MKIIDLIKRLAGKRMDRNQLAAVRVSMLVAALDGEVTGQEIGEFRRLAESCDGYTPEELEKHYLATIKSAGFLMLLSRVATEDELIEAFVIEAEKILPIISGFGPQAIKVSVEMWKSMAGADGCFSEVELKAISRLETMLKTINTLQRSEAGFSPLTFGNHI